MLKRIIGSGAAVVLMGLMAGCVAPRDYTALRAHMPKSVLVLPPQNQSLDLRATYGVLSTVTEPLAELGYYVYPVAVIDQLLKENGLPSAGEMHQIPLYKVREIIGADAVLYMTVEEYGTKYLILDSSTIVRLRARLVDVRTGAVLWDGRVNMQMSGSSGGGGLLGAIVSSAVNQVLASATDQAHDLTKQAHTKLLATRNKGLLYGPRHPEFGLEGR